MLVGRPAVRLQPAYQPSRNAACASQHARYNLPLKCRGRLLSDVNADSWVSSGHRPMGFPEFVIVIAAIMALNPLAMDMMLPALPNIGAAFKIPEANHLQLVLSTF